MSIKLYFSNNADHYTAIINEQDLVVFGLDLYCCISAPNVSLFRQVDSKTGLPSSTPYIGTSFKVDNIEKINSTVSYIDPYSLSDVYKQPIIKVYSSYTPDKNEKYACTKKLFYVNAILCQQ